MPGSKIIGGPKKGDVGVGPVGQSEEYPLAVARAKVAADIIMESREGRTLSVGDAITKNAKKIKDVHRLSALPWTLSKFTSEVKKSVETLLAERKKGK